MIRHISSLTFSIVRFLKGLADNPYVLYLAFILFIVHFILSIWCKDFAWLASYGGLLAVFGLIISFSYSFPIVDLKEDDYKISTDPDEAYVMGGAPMACLVTKGQEEVKDNKAEQHLKKYDKLGLFILTTAIGSVLSSYSGHLNKLMGWGAIICSN